MMPRRKQTKTEKMLAVLVRPDWTMDELMSELRMNIEQVAAMLSGDYERSLLQSLRFLEDFRTQMTVSRHRVTAVHRLITLMNDKFEDKDREILRRACAELLRTKIVPDETGGQVALAMIAGDEQVTDMELLAALRRIGSDEQPGTQTHELRLLGTSEAIDTEVVQ